jgi:MoxR-like ATPase
MTTVERGPLVGREREIAEASVALEGAAGGRGRLLMLVGEPGIGKTSLADTIAATAASRGFRVLWGRCWNPAARRPTGRGWISSRS